MEEKIYIRKATLFDIDSIIKVIQDRIDWMDEVGIEQWNKTSYLEVYPREYFEAFFIVFFAALLL